MTRWSKSWLKTRPEGDCLVWTGCRDKDGYGRWGDRLAHRVAYQLTHGAIAPGARIRHSCDNPPCVKPSHLSSGTQADNVADAWARNRMPLGEQHPRAKLTWRAVRAIRGSSTSQQRLASKYGVNQTTISRIVRGLIWREGANA